MARPDDYHWTEEEKAERRRVISVGFTEAEADCWVLVARAAGAFLDLPQVHPSDIPESILSWHDIQTRLIYRPTYRAYRETWPKPGTQD
ncbi:hypothetical protein [Streptomyces luteolus]|uniref:Uncharacterized protein n=1 Tax=Streptomyces luteolus TaxID=3043615 RepID=A0ABT6SW06_9ACTN|nr:hypothetical protein [Streptomyces sp. B-S-A12]MDI3419034.1 hypothetical protein [Streptomyces sp. B-S-A12]